MRPRYEYKSETLNKGPVPLAVREGYIQLKSVDFFNKSRPRHLDKGPKLKRLPKKRIKVLFPEKSEIIGKPYLMVVSLISGS